MSNPPGPGAPSPFSLETDDRTDEERAKSRQVVKNDFLGSALAMAGSERPKSPMDTNYQEELKVETKIKFNLRFDKKIRGIPEHQKEIDQRFDLQKLFLAASTGDVTMLNGLREYLNKTMKKLTFSEYNSSGKNPLLKALLNLKPDRNPTVEYFLNIAEEMGDLKEFVNAAYTDSYYKGQSALHIAIERRSIHYVELLISKGADVHARACGTFFQPHNGPCFYFGELPLSLAACTNQREMVDILIKNDFQRVNVEEKDSHGNTVLHSLVTVADNSPENTDFIVSMYDYILTTTAHLNPKLNLEIHENNQGLTPIKLAAKTGKLRLFEHIVHREFYHEETRHLSRKFTEWAYGPVYSSLYDLASLDSYENNSVLEILVYGSDIPNRHEMLQIEPLNRLLEDKWEKFAGRLFLLNFLVYFIYLSIFTVVSYNRKEGTPPFPIEHTTSGYLHLACQLLIMLASGYFFIGGLLDFKRKRPNLQTLLIDGYCDILFFLQGAIHLVSCGLYACGRQEYLGLMVMCLALSWVNLLYFSRGCRHMGIYSVMIQKMIISDILRFLFVYIVFLFGFSAAVVTLMDEPSASTDENPASTVEPPVFQNRSSKHGRTLFGSVDDGEKCQKPTFKSIAYTTLELFKFTIGMGDLEFTDNYKYKEVFYVLLISYIILTYILLFNMLIALMSRTVEKITKESAGIWKLQRAITILDLERSLSKCLKKRFRCGVQKDLGFGEQNVPDSKKPRFFRVEEVNWNKWNINMRIINEDPGMCCTDGLSFTSNRPVRTRSWGGILRAVSRRRLPPQDLQSAEMTPLSNSSV